MLNYITESLKDKLDVLNIWEKVYQYVELFTNSQNETVPSEYVKKGQHKPLKYDQYNGQAYIRKVGRTALDKNTNPADVDTCDKDVVFFWPLRIVSILKKENYTDNCFTDDELGIRIITAIQSGYATAKNDIGARRMELEFSGIETGKEMIVRDEYPGKDLITMSSLYSYIAVDFTVKVTANPVCLNNLCDAYSY